jgi:hypothetical protein
MKRLLILSAMILTVSSCIFAQESGGAVFFQNQTAGPVAIGIGMAGKGSAAPVQGAPYSATIKNENIQILADGNRIVQTNTGSTARDSQGRTRQDESLPAIGNLSATDAPHLVFIQDPVAKTAYMLNLTDKTAKKMPALPLPMNSSVPDVPASGQVSGSGGKFMVQMADTVSTGGPGPGLAAEGMVMQRTIIAGDQGKATTEDLGSQTMEGVLVNGVRTTHTIPAGEIGNDKPISIVTEVWASPDLKTIVYSKRTDPRMGEQTFQLTNVVRSEPDASLFTVPSDFKTVDGPQNVIYRSNQ